ncbi:hypothetical protein RugamoR64_44440 [Duganella rhizosphaerae]
MTEVWARTASGRLHKAAMPIKRDRRRMPTPVLMGNQTSVANAPGNVNNITRKTSG